MTSRPSAHDDAEDAGLTPEVRAELDAFATRRRHDPPVAVWRAADAEALPEGAQASLASSLAGNAWAQQLVAGANDASADASLDESEATALLERIHRAAKAPAPIEFPRARRLIRYIVPLAAAAAVVLVTLRMRPPAVAPSSTAPAQPAAPTASAPRPAAPAFVIPLEPAAVKLTPSALVRRSPSSHGVFTDDAALAFEAYRAGRYDDAAEAFTKLSTSYPASPEAAFYLGVSRLMMGDAPAAATALTTARGMHDAVFHDDIEWYLAIAEERRGDPSAARATLAALCQEHSTLSARACDAAAKFPAK